MWLGVAAGAFVVAAIAAGGFTLATRGGGGAECARQTFPDQGRAHITAKQKPPKGFKYNSFPPTSGWHDVQPAVFNAFDASVDQRMLLHTYEHGGIGVQYGKDIPDTAVREIADWYRADPNGIVVAPLPDSPESEKLRKQIVLTAWRQLAVCSAFDEGAFSGFRDDFRGKGPEKIPVEDLQPGT
jgi:hypothetical protein